MIESDCRTKVSSWRCVATVAVHQVRELGLKGISEFHFTTLNCADLTYAICHALGLRPEVGHG